MFSIAFAVLALLASPLALAAPTTPDAGLLLKNGQAAQALNAQFQQLKTSDSCNTGETACVKGLIAECADEQWETQKCPGGSRQCFALPLVKENGTVIACTSEANALSLIAATGAKGGLASDTSSNGTDSNDQSGNDNGESSTKNASGNGIVTVTVILPPPGSTATLPSETRTINPDVASSILSSAAAASTAASSVSASTTSSASIVEGTSSSASSSVNAKSSSASVIQLTRSPAPAKSSASVAAAAAAAPTAGPIGGSGY